TGGTVTGTGPDGDVILSVDKASLQVGGELTEGDAYVAGEKTTQAAFSCTLSSDKGSGIYSESSEKVTYSQSGSDWTFTFPSKLTVTLDTSSGLLTLDGTLPSVEVGGVEYALKNDFQITVKEVTTNEGKAAFYRNQFKEAVHCVIEDLEDIAQSASSDKKIVTAIDDIVRQYVALSTDISLIKDTAIFWTVSADSSNSMDLDGNPLFEKALLIDAMTNKHVKVKQGKVKSFKNKQSDYQLTITSGDSHVTKLTVTPASEKGYYQTSLGASAILNAVSEDVTRYLLCYKVPVSFDIKMTYNDVTLMESKVEVDYPNKTDGSVVYENSPHTVTLKSTLYPQDNKDYTVGIDMTSTVTSADENSVNGVSELDVYRKKGSEKIKTLFSQKSNVTVTVSNDIQSSALIVNSSSLNVGDRIEIKQSDSLDVVAMNKYYSTGTDATEETVKSNVEKLNELLKAANPAVYLNKSVTKAGDVRALAGKIANYYHARLGVQFTGADTPELVADVADQADLMKLRSLLGGMSGQMQAISRLLMSMELMPGLGGNQIIQIILSDLFGSK
ncbi:MAG: hypothetical protein K6E38_06960, partial [Fretibacterium sp.]|nr:hypothetical protein [Fretibacterium sp.]